MPNSFAYLVLFSWPVVAFLLFRERPLAVGIAGAIIGGYLLLPARVTIDLPMLPAFDKDLSATLAALLLAAAGTGRAQTPGQPGDAVAIGWIPRGMWARLCLAGLVIGPILSVATNMAPLVYGPTVIQGTRPYDILAFTQTNLVQILPFLIARKYLCTPQAQGQLLVVLAIAAALYALPTLYEVRMSPQLSAKIYGFFPHSFTQHLRGDGYRPVVFLNHGLRLSLFLALGLLAAIACFRLRRSANPPRFLALAGFLFIALVMSKSLGALMIALILVPVMLFGTVRFQFMFAAVLTATILVYPVLRGANLVPVSQILTLAATIDPQRAGSFEYRLRHEDMLLEKAAQKPIAGWSGWGRWRVFDAEGRDISTADGAWVIVIGEGGWLRYLSVFGLLCVPTLIHARRRRAGMATSALSVVLLANLIDLIPNSGLSPMTWLIAGTLTGSLETQRGAQSAAAAPPEPAPAVEAPSPYAPRPAQPSRAPAARQFSPYAPGFPKTRNTKPPGGAT